AQETRIARLNIGLAYTAVRTEPGGVGLANTFAGNIAPGCCAMDPDQEFEGRPASALLPHILSGSPVYRSMALALINALNYEEAAGSPGDDRENDILFRELGLESGSRVAMIGYFKPLVERLNRMRVGVDVADLGRGIGDTAEVLSGLGEGSKALILSATSIINGTVEDILRHVPAGVPVALLGPSAPLCPEAFAGTRVSFLAGTVPFDFESTFRVVRHGKGTPALKRYGRKIVVPVRG
ncbi:MAG: Rossmann-like domain-containing protein, partial [Desulfonatronovibrionaceae bacterium]